MCLPRERDQMQADAVTRSASSLTWGLSQNPVVIIVGLTHSLKCWETECVKLIVIVIP